MLVRCGVPAYALLPLTCQSFIGPTEQAAREVIEAARKKGTFQHGMRVFAAPGLELTEVKPAATGLGMG